MSASGGDGSSVRHFIEGLQHRLATGLGIDEHKRGTTVISMHENNARRAPGYWIQLFLAMGIATLGLVLGSTAVVIGAMLVSPLMGPIIELGMGFAVGSSLLVIRAFIRITLSIIVVVTGAALFTLALPFHEVTTEIAARAAPTALDLLVAIFCALTAAYTTVRPGADSTAAAAGTAIGIALVPPLCTIGFGLGTLSVSIAGGAALLFTANFSAILVFAVLAFLALGFNQVDAEAIESQYVTAHDTRTDRAAMRAHRVVGGLFGSRYGFAMRLLIPSFVLAAVYVPLRRALHEVTWEVRTRDAIRRIVAAESPRAVQTSVVVERHAVVLRILVVGTNAAAARLEQLLTSRITASAGVVPTVSVVPVANPRDLAAAESRGEGLVGAAQINTLSREVADALAATWPSASGRLAGWRFEIGPASVPTIAVYHLGTELGLAGEQLLGSAVTARLGTPVSVHDVAILVDTMHIRAGHESVWRDSAMSILSVVAKTDSVVACVRGPVRGSKTTNADRALLSALTVSDAARQGRMVVDSSGAWSLRAAIGRCGNPS